MGYGPHMAVRSGSTKTVRVLLDHASMDSDALDGNGEHVICTAILWGHIDCLQSLLERNVPVEHLNSAATMAWYEFLGKTVDTLVAKGATLTLPY